MVIKEGVIKFNQEFIKSDPLLTSELAIINSSRSLFYKLGQIGQDLDRYNGAGYGNISQRIPPYDAPLGKRPFVITGTQTGGLEKLTAAHYTVVTEYDAERNFVKATGPIEASSESMTHGTIYDLDDLARFVIHTHSPYIWLAAKMLGIPITKETVEYGTPEMADEVRRLFRDTNVKTVGIFAMGGHEDGIFTFGKTDKEAGYIMLECLIASGYLKAPPSPRF